MGAATAEGLESVLARLIASVPASERGRFGRALASLEAFHRNQLHASHTRATDAHNELSLCRKEAALAAHTAAAQEAKLRCALEETRCWLSRRDAQLEKIKAQASNQASMLDDIHMRENVSFRLLRNELRMLEALHSEASQVLREVKNGVHRRGEHMQAVQLQSDRSTELLLQMQEQTMGLQKTLAAEQKRSARLQERQQAAEAADRSWSVERTRLEQRAAHLEERARIAEHKCLLMEEELVMLNKEASQERKASAEALHSAQTSYRHKSGKLQSELNSLRNLVEHLKRDQSKVALRSGGGSTVGDYTRSLQDRLARRGPSTNYADMSGE